MKAWGIDVDFEEFLAWSRYLYWADVMRSFYEAVSEEGDGPEADRRFPAMTYWYASLYVVIEGWKELALSDSVIDALLQHSQGCTDLFRRYRNAAFHYQPRIKEERFGEFLNKGALHVLWVQALHAEFVRFFWNWLEAFPGEKDEMIDRLRKGFGGLPEHPSKIDAGMIAQAERIAANSRPGDALHEEAMQIGASAKLMRETRKGVDRRLSEWRSQIVKFIVADEPECEVDSLLRRLFELSRSPTGDESTER
jgi:hypothetical protein